MMIIWKCLVHVDNKIVRAFDKIDQAYIWATYYYDDFKLTWSEIPEEWLIKCQ